MPRRPGRGRRRRQLGRPGGALPRRATRPCGPADRPRATALDREHVALPRRPHRARPDIEVCTCTEVRELVGDDALEALVVEDNRDRRARERSRRARCSSSSAPRRTRGWLGEQVALDDGGFVLTGPERPAREAPTSPVRCCSRPAGRACSPRATCAAGRSSASPRPSARARWRSGWCTSGSTTAPGARPSSTLRRRRLSAGSRSIVGQLVADRVRRLASLARGREVADLREVARPHHLALEAQSQLVVRAGAGRRELVLRPVP